MCLPASLDGPWFFHDPLDRQIDTYASRVVFRLDETLVSKKRLDGVTSADNPLTRKWCFARQK